MKMMNMEHWCDIKPWTPWIIVWEPSYGEITYWLVPEGPNDEPSFVIPGNWEFLARLVEQADTSHLK